MQGFAQYIILSSPGIGWLSWTNSARAIAERTLEDKAISCWATGKWARSCVTISMRVFVDCRKRLKETCFVVEAAMKRANRRNGSVGDVRLKAKSFYFSYHFVVNSREGRLCDVCVGGPIKGIENIKGFEPKRKRLKEIFGCTKNVEVKWKQVWSLKWLIRKMKMLLSLE